MTRTLELGTRNLPPDLTDQLRALRARIRHGYPFWLSWVVRADVLAITLGRSIYLAPALLERGDELLTRTLRHELVHVEQAGRIGLVRFLHQYVRDYLHLRRSGLGSAEAYAAIPFEVEARAAEGPATPDSPRQL